MVNVSESEMSSASTKFNHLPTTVRGLSIRRSSFEVSRERNSPELTWRLSPEQTVSGTATPMAHVAKMAADARFIGRFPAIRSSAVDRTHCVLGCPVGPIASRVVRAVDGVSSLDASGPVEVPLRSERRQRWPRAAG